jgi:hypothetical protein
MEVALSQRQLNNLVKGRPVQMSHSALTSSSPNVAMEKLSDSLRKKIDRAIRESRGCRVQLSPEEASSVSSSLGGGKINIGKAFKKLGRNIKKGFTKDIINPTKKIAGVVERGFNKEIVEPTKKVAGVVERGFNREIVDSGLGKQIAKSLIDVGTEIVLPTALGGLSMLAGDPTGMSGQVVGSIAGKELNKLAGKYGYGVKGKQLKAIKDEMTAMFSPIGKRAKALTAKVFKEGDRVLDLPEISIRGGKITLKSIGRAIKKGAKDLWRKARPVLKHFGEKAIEYAEPLIEEGLSAVAQSYGVDPAVAEVGTKTLVSFGKSKAKRGLDKYVYKGQSQSPEMAIDKASAIVQQRGDEYIQKAKVKGLESIQKYVPADQRDMATQKLLEQTSRAEQVLRDRVEATEDVLQKKVGRKKGEVLQEVLSPEGSGMCGRGRRVGRTMLPSGRVLPLTSGGAVYGSLERVGMRDDMSTLLSPFHPATQTFRERPNLPQGQISGGSFRGYGTLEMDAMLGGSFM